MVEPVSVAEKVGVTPGTGLLRASRRVMVTDEVATPSAVTGPVPVIVEFPAVAEPGLKVTGVVRELRAAGAVMPMVFSAATVETIEPVATPFASVVNEG